MHMEPGIVDGTALRGLPALRGPVLVTPRLHRAA